MNELYQIVMETWEILVCCLEDNKKSFFLLHRSRT